MHKQTKNICQKSSGGKGNLGLFIERDPKIRAAGVPTAQPHLSFKDHVSIYSLQDEVNALVGDAIKPLPKVTTLPPLRYPKKRDMRNAGIFNEGSQLLNPPVKTKFQTLVEDFKNTTYNSYWKKEVGKSSDAVHLLPEGFKRGDITLGKKKTMSDNLYDVVMPTDPIKDKTPSSKNPGHQTNRNYCSFNPNVTFGSKSNSDRSGKVMKCCLTIDSVLEGTALKMPIPERLASFNKATVARLGMAHMPNNNIKCVSEGFAFGKLISLDNLPECLRTCEINPYKDLIKQCLGHLNTVRKCLSKRFDGIFFHKLYLNFKYLDKSKSGWLEKHIIYDNCNAKYVRLIPSLIEPLLSIWKAFDESRIEYKTFVRVIDYRQPSPELPKIRDIPEECIEFRTTYGDMVNVQNTLDNKVPMAGIPSGRYFDKENVITPDGCCKADRVYLPQESDMKSCICPSMFTLLGISHRDMYAKREPHIVRKVFERAGEKFQENSFDTIWNNAKKFHTQEWVSFDTFRRSLSEFKNTYERW